MLDDVPSLGDFGLVEYPGKEDLTTNARRLGPLGFQAPETLNDPVNAMGGPVDVYALAKTLWVLQTGLNFPLPDSISRSERLMRVSTYVDVPRVKELEAPLERATALDPGRRLGMSAFAEELVAWLREPESQPSLDLEVLGRQFEALTATDVQEDEARRQRAHSILELRHAMTKRIRPRFEDMKRMFPSARFHEGNNNSAIRYASVPQSHQHHDQGGAIQLEAPGFPELGLVLAYACSADADARRVYVSAGHVVHDGRGHDRSLWHRAEVADVQSIKSHQLAEDVVQDFARRIEAALAAFLAALAAKQQAGRPH